MSTYSIKDLEQLSGIKAHTLRIWEQRYAIIAPQRSDTNIRAYDDQDLKLVLNIAMLKDNGYKISDISKLSLDDLYSKVITVTDKQLSYPDQIQALTLAMLDFNEDRFEQIITSNIQRFGFENTMIHIIYPFLNRIGVLWVTDTVGPAQEHFITNLIRQKLIVAIEENRRNQRANGDKYLLFLPEGEYHEISLLFANYIISARSNKVIYLGQNLPFNELKLVYERHKPDYIFTVLTSSLSNHNVQPYVNRLAATFPDTQILLTGYQVVGQDIDTPDNTKIINQINDLIRTLS
ncbi:MerR family transcriptional regulator [Spirosoma spitsbergense]|uniref:MerR family transcriptional regulator n=1 Tax=Spirosoma spitsbergense TaxID=431554 RepID=UPI00036ACA2C|nr:MerR family transcriptional regulator [Spirosoma spitsbergense]